MVANKVMTCEEFAATYHMSVWTVQDKCRRGLIPAVKPGKRWMVLYQEYAEREAYKASK